MRRTKEDAELTRQSLLEAAIKVFSKQGYAATRLEDIAEAAKVTRGAVYHHFGGKAELFSEIIENSSQTSDRAIQRAIQELRSPEAAKTTVADAVPREEQRRPLGIPDREREDPVETAEHRGAVPAVEVEHDLGVRVAAERAAGRLELAAKLPEVVQLPVVDDGDRPGGVPHRLVAGGGQIDDREPAVRQSDAGFRDEERAVIVGAPVGLDPVHAAEELLVEPSRESGDPAHASRPPRPFGLFARSPQPVP